MNFSYLASQEEEMMKAYVPASFLDYISSFFLRSLYCLYSLCSSSAFVADGAVGGTVSFEFVVPIFGREKMVPS